MEFGETWRRGLNSACSMGFPLCTHDIWGSGVPSALQFMTAVSPSAKFWNWGSSMKNGAAEKQRNIYYK